jgi:hypothetical protein
MPQPCTFPDCQAPAVAKGLCAKHNMRLRRHGDPAKVERPGRKDQDSALRQMFAHLWSDRTYARYKRGVRLLRFLGLDVEQVVLLATRPNGTMNLAKFERIAEDMAVIALARLPE